MLNIDLFTYWIDRFKGIFPNSLDDDSFELFYETLKDWTDAEFDRISREIFDKEEFFPRPGTYARYKQETFKALADHYWKQAVIAAAKIETLTDSGLPDDVQDALRNMGGLRAIGTIPEHKLDSLKREFLIQFGYSSGYQKMPQLLPPSTPPQLTGNAPTIPDQDAPSRDQWSELYTRLKAQIKKQKEPAPSGPPWRPDNVSYDSGFLEWLGENIEGDRAQKLVKVYGFLRQATEETLEKQWESYQKHLKAREKRFEDARYFAELNQIVD